MNDICQANYNSQLLVNMWGDFIDWKNRRRGENGFLVKKLHQFNCKNIFDACLGDGVDSIHLIKQGFNVISNDIDYVFIEKAKKNAGKTPLSITQHDWRDLGKAFASESFDAVSCMGNSLTYLFKRKDHLKTLKNFRNLLRSGGILIIDERNFQYMLDKKADILKGDFCYSGKYVYCGKKVHGKPIEISENRVRMEYTKKNEKKKGHLVLYPFKRNELFSLLKEAGFSRVDRFSDYFKGYSPTADFYQYVCIK